MIHQPKPRSIARLFGATALLAAASFTLSACGGNGTSGGVLGVGTSNGYVRFLNGSPDDGAVDVQIDGNIKASSLGYGAFSTGYIGIAPGSHTVNIYVAAQDTGTPLVASTFSINGGTDYTVVITGELHPASGTANLGLLTFDEQPYSTPSGGAALDFHNAAPFSVASAGLNQTLTQFGYSINSAPADVSVGTAIGVGSATAPVGITNPAALNTPITLYETDRTTGVSVAPSQLAPTCTNNQLPCGTGNLSVYLVDGPAASSAADASLPTGVVATQKVAFFGLTDANGIQTSAQTTNTKPGNI